jgi:hypothetical protein
MRGLPALLVFAIAVQTAGIAAADPEYSTSPQLIWSYDTKG